MKRVGLTKTDGVVLTLVTIVFIVCAACLGVEGWHWVSSGAGPTRTITATVTDKGIKTDGQHSTYLIYTKDDADNVEVMMIKDNLLAGRFDASDDYAAIEVGKKYRFTVRGSRVRFLSWYPNIYEFKEVER